MGGGSPTKTPKTHAVGGTRSSFFQSGSNFWDPKNEMGFTPKIRIRSIKLGEKCYFGEKGSFGQKWNPFPEIVFKFGGSRANLRMEIPYLFFWWRICEILKGRIDSWNYRSAPLSFFSPCGDAWVHCSRERKWMHQRETNPKKGKLKGPWKNITYSYVNFVVFAHIRHPGKFEHTRPYQLLLDLTKYQATIVILPVNIQSIAW